MEKHFFTILFQEKYLSSKKTLRNLYHFKILFTRLHAFKSNKARNEGKGIRKRIQKKKEEETKKQVVRTYIDYRMRVLS